MEIKFTPDTIATGKEWFSRCRNLLTINYYGNLSQLLAKPLETLTDNEKLHINLHPSTLETAKLAQLSYKGKEEILSKLSQGMQNDNNDSVMVYSFPTHISVGTGIPEFTLIAIAQNGSYHASAYFREGNRSRKRQIVIAHRGNFSSKLRQLLRSLSLLA